MKGSLPFFFSFYLIYTNSPGSLKATECSYIGTVLQYSYAATATKSHLKNKKRPKPNVRRGSDHLKEKKVLIIMWLATLNDYGPHLSGLVLRVACNSDPDCHQEPAPQ